MLFSPFLLGLVVGEFRFDLLCVNQHKHLLQSSISAEFRAIACICSKAIRFLSDLVSCEAQALLFRVVLVGLLPRVIAWRAESFSPSLA
jgi:hypothetical protein